MNFKELYDNNRAAIETLLTAMWCGEARDERQKKYAERMKGAIGELFAPSEAYPVVQCMNLYKSVNSVSADDAKALVGGLWTKTFPPYEHQYQCWNTLLNKKSDDGKPMSIVVTTGTGSGKTECFMMPLVHDLIQTGKSNQIQALFLYPLNALMEDQKERLEEMLKGTELTYAVYNGDLPEKEPKASDVSDRAMQERKRIAQLRGEYNDADGTTKYKFPRLLYTREQIRATPPNILLTNPTMLEYVLLRQSDATLIDPALKSLRWVAIDETHSYTGAGAAELAMLLRRVLLAFDVKAEDVRFATSSATFGNATTAEEEEQERAKLREFIGGITGLAAKQIEVIGGVRIGEEAISDNADKPLWQKICKNDYMSLNDLFPAGTISEKLGLLEEMCKREDALEKSPALKMKVKVHYFYRVPNNGIYVKLTEQKDGCLKIYTQSALTLEDNKPPKIELTRCKHCGGFVAVALYDSATGAYEPMVSDESDMFDFEEEENIASNRKRPIMLGLRNDPIVMGDGNIMLKAKGDRLENVSSGELDGETGSDASEWFIVGNTNYRCPYCNAKVSKGKWTEEDEDDERFNGGRCSNLLRFRLSAELISRYLAPSILDQLEQNAGDGVLHQGQQYISFVDSRQAAAISTLNQNLEQEKMWVYNTIYHELCKRKAQETGIRAEIAALKTKYLEEDDDEILARIGELKKKISGYMSWAEIHKLLLEDRYCDIYCRFFAKRSHDSDEIDENGNPTDFGRTKYVHSIMSLYLGKRPKTAASPETMGLFHTTYPQLAKAKLPESVKAINEKISNPDDKIDERDWHDLLQVFLDHTVRTNESVYFRLPQDAAYNNDLDIFSLNRFASVKPHRRPVHRPHITDAYAGTLPRTAIYLGALLSESTDMVWIREAVAANLDTVNAVLDDLWRTLTDETKLIEWGSYIQKDGATKRILPDPPPRKEDEDEPYRMNLVKLNFRLYDNVRMCDVNGGEKVKCLRPIGVMFKGYSPYPTKSAAEKMVTTPETWSAFPYYRGGEHCGDAARLRLWMEDNRKSLIDSGLWGDGGLYKNRLDDIHLMPNLFVQAEHTAQVDKEVSRTLQSEFKSHLINILACSTTMEMGVDLGNLEVVMLSSVPPMPANYKQRAGRSGRNNKVRSVCLTLCGSDAVGLRTLFNPIERIISRPVQVPKVDLKSEQVVKRHVNSYLVREFGVFGDAAGGGKLTQKVVDFFTPFKIEREAGKTGRLIVVNPENGHQIHPDGGMGDDTGTRYKLFSDKCSNSTEVAKVKPGLMSLLRDTCFAGEENVDKVINEANETNQRCYAEISEKIADIKWAYDNQAKDNLKFKMKLEIQYLEILNEKLINYWATHRFTPNANMPVNVLALNLNSSLDAFTNSFSSNPSYSLREAISQYVPGNCVVVDGIVYKVRGIEFRNMYNPVNTFKTIQHNTDCVKIDEPVPSALQWPINEKADLTLVSPTGFLPDFNEDYTRIVDNNVYTHVSAQLIGASEWTSSDTVKMVLVRNNKEDSGNAKILYYNEGVGFGYCFCKKCGRMVLEAGPAPSASAATGLPPEMNNKRPRNDEDPNYHLAMNGKKFRQKCIGSNSGTDILRNVIIGDLIQTDYSELMLRTSPGGKWLDTREGCKPLLYTLAITFCQSLVEVLGKERGSVDFAITPTGHICIFDTNPGGAGYSNQLKDETIMSEVLKSAKKMLEEAKSKDASDMLLDKFTVRHIKQINVDMALGWINAACE